MKKLFNRERVIALVCLAFAAFIWFQAGTFPESFIDTVGPSKYPRLLAALIAVPSVVLLVTSNGPAGVQILLLPGTVYRGLSGPVQPHRLCTGHYCLSAGPDPLL